MLNKKGIAMEQLVVIIIVIISFMLIAGTLTRFLSKAEDKEAENLCRDSIALRAQTIINVNHDTNSDDTNWVHGQVKLIPPLCKTIDKKYSGSREEIKRQLADKMARCWWEFGEGQYEQILHGSELAPAIFNLDQTENKCFVCSTALIDEDEFDTSPTNYIPKEELLQYLATTNHPQISQMTYLEYIQHYGGPGKVALLEDIYPKHAYGISFLAKNAELEGNLLGGMFKVGGGLSIAAGTGIATTAITAITGGACVASVVCAVVAVGGVTSAFLLTTAGYSDIKVQVKDAFYESERDTSIVMIDYINVSQQKCFKGDLAGD